VAGHSNLTGLDPNYPDVTARLEQARIAQRRKALVDEMTALHQAGRWEGVVAAAQELARLDPGNPDPGGIVSDAKAKIRDAELTDRYAQAINHLDQQEWRQAADLFTAIEQEQPGYREAAALLVTAQGQRELAAWSDRPRYARSCMSRNSIQRHSTSRRKPRHEGRGDPPRRVSDRPQDYPTLVAGPSHLR
jgi:hypothetical protein